MEPFQIIVTVSGKDYRMRVERIYCMNDLERFRVMANNHTFLFDCNRPILLRINLGHASYNWTLVSGNCPKNFQDEIQREMERHVRRH